MIPNGPYDSKIYEKEILEDWLNNKIFKPEYDPSTGKFMTLDEMKLFLKNNPKSAWSLICPPPNAYGRTHIGNISGYAYQDAIARFARMQGKKVLVLPGKDHAGLEGEGVFVREVLEKKGIDKFSLSREEFYKMIWDFNMQNKALALNDEQQVGLSADFDRDTFTLDEDIVDTVLETFIEMYQKGMIYKGVRIVNWDPKARTAVADNQIEYKEAVTPFYYFKYSIPSIERGSWKLNFRKSKIFNAIKSGSKTLETRALNPEEPEKYFGNIKTGDLIQCLDKNTNELLTLLVKEARVYTDYREFYKNEDFTKIYTDGSKPDSAEQIIEDYNKIHQGYGEKIKNNGIVVIEFDQYNGDPEAGALELKKKFENKETNWKVTQAKGENSYLVGERHDGVPIVGIAYDNVPEGTELMGKVIGIQMRLDKKFRILVTGIDFAEDIDQVIESFSKEILTESAGSHIILFDKYTDDKFYTNGFIIGTVRPETVWADTAIACGIGDERYAEFIGKEIEVEFLGERKQLNFIEDYAVEKDFGTGLLKITPAHSQADWEIANRHVAECLPAIQVIGYDLRLNSLTGKYSGMRIKEARAEIEIEMLKFGNFVSVDREYQNKVQIAERTKAPIEPLLSSQWYLRYDGIKEAALKMVSDKKVIIHPENMVQKFNHWMENLRDWAISRSLWWGYRLPVWYAGIVSEEIDEKGQVKEYIEINGEKTELDYSNPNHLKVQTEKPGEDWIQDDNVLDTWFSSGQWPYATLKKHGLLDEFYPTNVMVSGHDILENWISRMMMFSHFKTGLEPFKDVYLTGLVLGSDGQKMSKSKGNLIDIDRVRTEYGTDAVRMSYFYQNKAGASYSITMDKLKNFKQFCNKIWNASRFVLSNFENEKLNIAEFDSENLKTEFGKKLMLHIAEVKQKVTANMFDYEFGYATETLYDEFWHTFCDILIEESKKFIYPEKNKDTGEITSEPSVEEKNETIQVMNFVLKEYLKMLHPFIPFITQKIWNEVPKTESDNKYITYTRW